LSAIASQIFGTSRLRAIIVLVAERGQHSLAIFYLFYFIIESCRKYGPKMVTRCSQTFWHLQKSSVKVWWLTAFPR